jgi:hypothetical protein
VVNNGWSAAGPIYARAAWSQRVKNSKSDTTRRQPVLI